MVAEDSVRSDGAVELDLLDLVDDRLPAVDQGGESQQDSSFLVDHDVPLAAPSGEDVVVVTRGPSPAPHTDTRSARDSGITERLQPELRDDDVRIEGALLPVAVRGLGVLPEHRLGILRALEPDLEDLVPLFVRGLPSPGITAASLRAHSRRDGCVAAPSVVQQ